MGRNTAYRPSTLGIIVITMNAEDRNCNIEIWVFVVDCWEAESHDHSFREIKKKSNVPVSLCSPVVWIAKELKLNSLVTKRVLPEKSHNLV